MLSGATPSACAIPGTAVLRIVVSSACMKKATATSHGSSARETSGRTGNGSSGVGMSFRHGAIYCAPVLRAQTLHVRQRLDGRHDRISAEVDTTVAPALWRPHARHRDGVAPAE